MNTTDVYLCRRQGWPYESIGYPWIGPCHNLFEPTDSAWTNAAAPVIELLRRQAEKVRRYPTDVYLCRKTQEVLLHANDEKGEVI